MTVTTITSGAPATSRPLLRSLRPLAVDPAEVDADTLCGVVLRQAERLRDRDLVRFKRDGQWLPVSWREAGDSEAATGAALVHHGVAAGDRVAILSENRLEWLTTDIGAQFAGAAVVPIYASATAESVGQVLRDSGAVAVFCSTPAQAAKVAEVRHLLPSLRLSVLFEGGADGFASFANLGDATTDADVAELEARLRAVRPPDILTVIYTSGTTGVPKGVVLTHANIVPTVRAVIEAVGLRESDRGITFLPWAHIYERALGLFSSMIAGVPGSIAEGLDDIGGDLRAVRPTVMNGVPRMWEKMQEAIVAQIRAAGGRRAAIGLRALDDCTERARRRRRGEPVPAPLALRCRLWDRLVIGKIREGLGGEARLFSSGGGPINIATLEFFDALGIAITEGYGLTETSGGITVNDPRAPRFGTVGRAIRGHEIRIADDGEILVRGPGVMQGYYNNAEATADVLTEDGWFRTGDIGELDADGYLRITDRKKDLIVTAGGKNIAPAPIEAAMMQDPLVARACVVGDRRKYLVALVVPDFPALREWARGNGVTASTEAELAVHPKVGELYTSIAERCSERLARYETIKRVAVLDRDLDEQRGELTPTLKVKRKVVMEHFAGVIDRLYQ